MAQRLFVILTIALALAIPLTAGVTSPPARSDRAQATAIVTVAGLPATVAVKDVMGAALAADLEVGLDVVPAPAVRNYRAGDVAYWNAQHRLYVFLGDGSAVPEGGLVIVGHVSDGLDDLRGCLDTCDVTFIDDEH